MDLTKDGKYSTQALIAMRDKLATELFTLTYKNNMAAMTEDSELRGLYEDISIKMATSFINKLSKA